MPIKWDSSKNAMAWSICLKFEVYLKKKKKNRNNASRNLIFRKTDFLCSCILSNKIKDTIVKNLTIVFLVNKTYGKSEK